MANETPNETQPVPQVVCPVCSTPIPFGIDRTPSTRECSNELCAMVGHNLEVHLSYEKSESDKYIRDLNPKEKILLSVDDIRTGEARAISTYKPPLKRFRLIDKNTLERLLKPALIDNWIRGSKNYLLKIETFSYDKGDGQLSCKDGFPVTEELGTDYQGLCPLKKFIQDILDELKKENITVEDPCEKCHKSHAGKVAQYAQDNPARMQLVTSNDNAVIRSDELKALSNTCWAGLTTLVLPIMLCDVVIGQGVFPPKRILNMPLSVEDEASKIKILKLLKIDPETFEEEFNKIKPVESLDELADVKSWKYFRSWKNFRVFLKDLQNLAKNRYGQIVTARSQILADHIEKDINYQALEYSLTSEGTVWKEIGFPNLKKIAEFFSFYQVDVFEKKEHGGFARYSVMNDSIDLIQLNDDQQNDIHQQLLSEVNLSDDPSAVVVHIDKYWYLFGGRKFQNNKKPRAFNAVSSTRMVRMIRSFHREFRGLLAIQRRFDDIIGMVHNIKRPAAQLKNALFSYDAIVHGTNSASAALIFADHSWMKQAIDEVYDAADGAARRIEFESTKLKYARDIKGSLHGPMLIPINNRIGSFWPEAQYSLKLFVGNETTSGFKMRHILKATFKPYECVSISPVDLKLLLDNLSDNAVKFSYPHNTVTIELERDTHKGEQCIKYTISNYGHGIDEADSTKLGIKGYRGTYSNTKNHKTEGTGLGIYTIQKVLKHVGGEWNWYSDHGGEENYVSGEGFKTYVYIWLPIKHMRHH